MYFDGQCPLCAAEVAFYQKRVGSDSVKWMDVSDSSEQLPADLDRPSALKRFHVRLIGGQMVDGARAFVALWSTTPGCRPLALLFDNRLMLPVAEFGYRVFLLLRPLLQHLVRRTNRRSTTGKH